MNDYRCKKWPLVPCKNESDAVSTRRDAIDLPHASDEHPHYALALSGGGIRSATFSLGLIRAMATNGVFKRFDYMSTVSGGGYLGGMIGELYNSVHNASAVEAGLSDKHSVLLWWIRNNGRYLTPSGARDVLMALTQIIRAFFFNFLLMTWMAALICAPALWVGTKSLFDEFIFFEIAASYVIGWLGSIYWLTALKKWYWGAASFALFIPLYFLYHWLWMSTIKTFPWFLEHVANPLYHADITAITFAAVIVCVPIWLHCLSVTRTKQRNLLTRYLLCASLFAVGVGFVYGLGYMGNSEFIKGKGNWFIVAILATTIIGKLLTILLNKIERSKKALQKAQKKPNMLGFANLAGLVLALFLLMSGTIGLGWLQDTIIGNEGIWPNRWHGWPTVIVWGLVICLSFSKAIPSLLNLSSMHNFYRARLERAWLAVGNAVRFPLNILSSYNRIKVSTIKQVTDVLEGDETLLRDYVPWAYGGPVHLITCCINQTIDDRTGMYNADRKGLALTIGPMGVETGTQTLSQNNLQKINGESLAQWIAISGAAFSTGLGSRTAPGISFLCFLFGVRTGFWHPNFLPHNDFPGWLTPIGSAGYICGEMFARFPDLNSKQIYLTDGGHFENTGVYPLLKREVPLIVVADCGADPEYIFDDLENLVRKAHIDYGASIDFYRFRYRKDRPSRKFTSMEAMRKRDTSPPLLLARIAYRSGITGTLLVVKPHNISGMPLDTLAYSQREADFPQQTTIDQFFDESQWEAYHQLGLQMGEHITPRLLKRLMTFTRRFKP